MAKVKLTVVARMDQDCWMCERGQESNFRTTMSFQDEYNGNVVNLCVEHMDAIVSEALDRHGRELRENNEDWYTLSDADDEAEQLIEMERQLADEQLNRLVEEEAEKWQTG